MRPPASPVHWPRVSLHSVWWFVFPKGVSVKWQIRGDPRTTSKDNSNEFHRVPLPAVDFYRGEVLPARADDFLDRVPDVPFSKKNIFSPARKTCFCADFLFFFLFFSSPCYTCMSLSKALWRSAYRRGVISTSAAVITISVHFYQGLRLRLQELLLLLFTTPDILSVWKNRHA